MKWLHAVIKVCEPVHDDTAVAIRFVEMVEEYGHVDSVQYSQKIQQRQYDQTIKVDDMQDVMEHIDNRYLERTMSSANWSSKSFYLSHHSWGYCLHTKPVNTYWQI